MWQFYVLLVLNVLSIFDSRGYITGEKKKIEQADITGGIMMIITALMLFGMYMSYSLYAVGSVFGLLVVIIHWTSSIYFWFHIMMTKKSIAIGQGMGLYKLAYSLVMTGLLIAFGFENLW